MLTNCLLSLKANSSESIVHIFHSAPLDPDFSWNIKWVGLSLLLWAEIQASILEKIKWGGLCVFELISFSQ